MTDRVAPGGQNERTALAWQRTALSLVAGAAVLTRLTLDRLGWLSAVPVAVALPLGAFILATARRRYRRRAGDVPPKPPTGLGPLSCAAVVVVLGAVELAALVVAP